MIGRHEDWRANLEEGSVVIYKHKRHKIIGVGNGYARIAEEYLFNSTTSTPVGIIVPVSELTPP